MQVFANEPRFFWAEKGKHPHEDIYAAWGQTDGGRYLIVFFIYKTDRHALVTSAREMDGKERKRYGRK
ncbi:MAG: BrnT family toxin [Chloroflexi bacterium]|nr:BrnT family toxin [Chloroflexota bacterium]